MNTPTEPESQVIDYITGRRLTDIGAEQNRQLVERFLVEKKGYRKEDIEVDAPIAVNVNGERYVSTVDLVVSIDGRRLIAIKSAAGSLDSREREIIAAARLIDDHPLPWAAVSDGHTAIVWDIQTGRKIGESLDALASRAELINMAREITCPALTAERIKKESLIFRSYDSMNVNVSRGRPENK